MLYTKSNVETAFTPIDKRTFGGEETGFFDNLPQSYKLDVLKERIDSPYLTRSEVVQEYFKKLTEIPGHESALTDIQNKFNLSIPSPMGNMNYNPLNDPIASSLKAPAITPDMLGANREMQGETYYEQFKNAVGDYVENNPDVKESLGEFNDDKIQKLAIEKVKQLQLEQQDSYRRSTGMGVVGSFVGTMGALATDPVNVAAMIATRRPAVGWFKNAWRESIAAGVSEGIIQKAAVEDWYGELGLEYTQEDFINRVLFAGGAGFVFGGGAEFISEKLRKSMTKLEQQRAAASGQPYEPNRDMEVMFNMFDIHNMVKAESPMQFDIGGITHSQRESNAYTALVTGDFSKLSDSNVYIPKTYNNIYHYDLRQPNTELVDPATLLKDPQRFQIKKKKIKLKAKEWDPVSAGTSVVYEFSNGTRYIVDGHSRVDLANVLQKAEVSTWGELPNEFKSRLSALTEAFREFAPVQSVQLAADIADGNIKTLDDLVEYTNIYNSMFKGKTQKAKVKKITMPAIVLKESNGITPEQASLRAAGKNLAEGSITEADLKALYKKYNVSYVKLPTNKALPIKEIDELKALADDVYEMVTRGDVPAEYGAIVGRLIADPALQKAAMKSLMLLDAKTLPEAENIVRQIQQKGLTTTVREMNEQFGERVLAVDLYKERATLLEKAIPLIANQNEYLSNLLNALNITGLGKEQKYAKIIQLIYGNANVKSGLSDSLTKTAEAYAKGGRKNAEQYARQFADDVLRNAEQRDFIRVPDGSNISPDAVAPQRPKSTPDLDKGLEEFSQELDLKGQQDLSRMTEATIRADDNLLNQTITVDRMLDDGKIEVETITMRQALDEASIDDKSFKLLKACSSGVK